jgi:hypothetical protein
VTFGGKRLRMRRLEGILFQEEGKEWEYRKVMRL